MSFNAPETSWRRLADQLGSTSSATVTGRVRPARPAEAPARRSVGGDVDQTPFVELHCHSNFSFLDGASHPEELAVEAARLGLTGLALTDHDGMYGVVRLSSAARDVGVGTAFGSELSLGLSAPQNGEADPEGTHLLAVARGPEGYAALCRVISSAHLRADAEKGKPVYDEDELVDELRGRVLVLTGGCRKGTVRQALAGAGSKTARAEAAMAELLRLVDRYGRDHVAVELVDHGYPDDSARNDVLTALAREARVPIVATGAVHYAAPARGRLAAAMAAVRAHRSLDEMAGWLPPAPAAFLRSGAEMAHRFRRYPGAVSNAALLGGECLFDLKVIAPRLPPFDVPDGHTEDSWLRVLTERGAHGRYGSRQDSPRAWAQIDRELDVIEALGFPGYFLVVHDIVKFCRDNDILCQGRGSAANSAVCYALGITAVDPVRWELLFERFLHPDRDGPPDIDVDIESGRREEVIQYVFGKHGRRHAAQVCNVITYRPKSAVRDMARALGFTAGQQDAWSKQIDAWTPLQEQRADQEPIPDPVRELAIEIDGFPRHLGIHSGGMVICDRPVSEVVPVERARMDNRTVLQWDKDDCATTGLVKFDLLGLGMLSAVHFAVDLVAEHEHQRVDIAHLDLADKNVYDMLCEADTVGVFQVESRAQMSTLPRLKPRNFWDLAIEVGLIRPGPIQGGSVHPFIARRNGKPWRHDHPLLASALDRTLGVPIFQEQIMQIAVDVAGFTPGEADELRRAMGSKRSAAKMERLKERFYAGMAANEITGLLADSIFGRVAAFATYGFPMSHALSFAHIVFVSAWFKRYHPAAFCAALLRAQPMGFYSPQTLVADARRHGVRTHRADVTTSLAHTTLEPDPGSTGGVAVRLGLDVVRTITTDTAQRVVDARADGPFADLADLARRAELATDQLEALATAGALTTFGASRRDTLWMAGAAARDRAYLLPGTSMTSTAPTLPGMTTWELAAADLWATRITPDGHPVELMRAYLHDRGALPAAAIGTVEHGTRVSIGGAVTHRQRPPGAGGITFISLEDETGLVNIVVHPGTWNRYGLVAKGSAALIVRGIVERSDGATNLVADRLEKLDLNDVDLRSRDYR
ncbi:error-prone DNA polymerase [Lentzea sp. NPDC092896]|uniref:error-prone DNA polymerase n=1 Tax=Lentzea sp. NPDC092896 TaxID=3364127 RepID=UPI00382030D3